jgi:hypothetical protein
MIQVGFEVIYIKSNLNSLSYYTHQNSPRVMETSLNELAPTQILPIESMNL